MNKNVFQQVKSRLSMQAVVEAYGFHPDRNGRMSCPIHGGSNRTAFQVRDDSFHCFVCGAHGTVIDFAQAVSSLSSPIEAARELNDRFGLGLAFDRPMTEQEREQAQRTAQRRELERQAEQAFEAWEQRAWIALTSRLRELRQMTGDTGAEDNQILFEMDKVEHWLDILCYGTSTDKIKFFRHSRQEVLYHEEQSTRGRHYQSTERRRVE